VSENILEEAKKLGVYVQEPLAVEAS